MNLAELKERVDSAVEAAGEYGEKPEDIAVTLQITTFLDPTNVIKNETVWADDEVELHYDNNGQASGCVLTAAREVE